jgi:hypothetical protein
LLPRVYLLTLLVVGAAEGAENTTGAPPLVPGETKNEILGAAQTGATGVHATGGDAGAAPAAAGPPKIKTEKECKKHARLPLVPETSR